MNGGTAGGDRGSSKSSGSCPALPDPVAFVCKGGDDAGPGTEAQPYATFGRARMAFASLQPGESVAFCRGGTFQRSGGSWVNSSCTVGNPCGITAYGPENLPRPVLTGSGNAIDFANGGNAEHEEGYIVTELTLRGDGTGTGFTFYNDIDDVVLCAVDIIGFNAGINLQRGNPPNPGSDGENDRIALLDSYVADNASQGWLGACNGCRIEGNRFERNGGAGNPPNRDHSIYLDSHRPVSNIVVRNNDLYQTTASVGRCEGAPFTAHGTFTDLLLEGNHVHEDPGKAGGGCWGIVPDTGYGSEAESFTRVIIRNNVVENVGSVSIGVNACDDCLIEGNTVRQSFSGTAISSPHRRRGDNDAQDGVVTFKNNVVTMAASGKCFDYGPTVVDGGGNQCL
jgi:hypothetical protein